LCTGGWGLVFAFGVFRGVGWGGWGGWLFLCWCDGVFVVVFGVCLCVLVWCFGGCCGVFCCGVCFGRCGFVWG
ncbi:hypothetical protein RA269_28090, partial [Pseudomonas syringae pv. tagetis]|uniref:hypothetical protein n=1 Tax=Pseudomonas syringae group genomosp. 7 TaxID=251699 RepID=UPI00376FA84D